MSDSDAGCLALGIRLQLGGHKTCRGRRDKKALQLLAIRRGGWQPSMFYLCNQQVNQGGGFDLAITHLYLNAHEYALRTHMFPWLRITQYDGR